MRGRPFALALVCLGAVAAQAGDHGGGDHRGGHGAPAPVVEAPPVQVPPKDDAAARFRALQSAQTLVARGDLQPGALAAPAAALAKAVGETSDAAWAESRASRALAGYLLNGGEPSRALRLLAAGLVAPQERPLVEAAVAYLTAPARAKTLFAAIDARALAPGLAGQVAFVQANLLLPEDREGALARLDLARLLSPGGLVEEAALRREALLVAETGPVERFADLATRYRRRFGRSPYAELFERGAMEAATRFWIVGDERARRALAPVIAEAGQAAPWAALARRALLAGRPTIALDAAQRGVDAADPQARRAAAFLVAAARAAVGDADALRATPATELAAPDRLLRDAALTVADAIHAPPASTPSAPPVGAADPVDDTIARAAAVLERAP